MKKSVALIIIVLVSSILFSACGSRTFSKKDKLEPTKIENINDFKGVSMTVKKETVTPTGLTVNIENNSGKDCRYCILFALEAEIDNKWYEIPVINVITYDFPLEMLSPGDKTEMETNWEMEYGSLGRGKYRIIKSLEEDTESGESDPHYYAAEFEIE